ncbi:MAG: hypothetical protein HYZ45_13160, partial [Burkholderiales bacterium]|nr:hypothetical protein [Burkholderiales bacterium]
MPVKRYHSPLRYFSSALLLLWQLPASAIDLNWSAFGTLGYSRSNSSYEYDRVVNDQATLRYT